MRYAAYGSNLHPLRLRERAASAELLGTAALPGKGLRFHKRGMDGSAKCGIVATEDAIYVAVYEIAAHDKVGLDGIEGHGYRGATQDVPGYGECYLYIAEATHIDESLQPYAWYKELVLVGCEHLQFPEHYIERIAAVAASEDPDRVRHEQHMRLVRRARDGG